MGGRKNITLYGYQGKQALSNIRAELKLLNESAVRSLDEGLEETLTLHRLGVFQELGISLKTTNCLESINSQVARLTGRITFGKTAIKDTAGSLLRCWKSKKG